MRSIYWHKIVNRPITDADLGRFVVGRSPTQWFAGYLVKNQTHGGPLVDTQYQQAPSAQFVCANSMRIYAFLNGPHPSDDDMEQGPLAKVVRLW